MSNHNSPQVVEYPVPHYKGPAYYTVRAVCTNNPDASFDVRGIRARGPVEAVRKIERLRKRTFDQRWQFHVSRSKDLNARRRRWEQAEHRSPWAVLAKHRRGARKSTRDLDRQPNLYCAVAVARFNHYLDQHPITG